MKSFIKTAAILAVLATSHIAMADTAEPYDSNSQARVRLFGQNQKPTFMTTNINCETNKKGGKVNVGASLSGAFGSLLGTVKNKSIGIPETENTQMLSQRNGILSKAYYQEFAVVAGKPVNVEAAYIGLTTTSTDGRGSQIINKEGSCTSNIASFMPKAGRDYEVIGLDGRGCGVAVLEVVKNAPDQVALQDIPLSAPLVCSR